jgi:nucleoside-diphosphate-sugar epimerase
MTRSHLQCVVTGATGAVGPAVTRRIAREPGTSVLALARHAPAPGLLPANARFEAADLFDSGTLSAVRDAEIVFHLAARLHTSDPGASLRDEYERTNLEATRRLVDATPPSARFVFFSTIDVYGPTPAGTQATERTPPAPRSLYGDTKLRAEKAVLEHPNGVVLRLAAVYGPRVKANYARLARALAKGRYVQIGSGRNLRTVVFEDDVADAAWTVGRAERLSSRVYNVTDGGVHSVADIVAAIGRAIGRSAPRWFLPAPPVRVAAAVADSAMRLVGRRSPVTPQMIDKLQENVAVSGERLMLELAFKPRFDLAAGWAAAVHPSHP